MVKILATFLLCCLTLFPIASTTEAARVLAQHGSRGEAVEQIQAMLMELRLYDQVVDGEYGDGTTAAVKTFQRKMRRAQSGKVDTALFLLLSRKSGLDFREFKHVKVMHASAYSPHDPGVNRHTSTGARLSKGVVAVDPRVIPLGSKLYIIGYGFGTAADTGGFIKGNVIDIAFNSRHEALHWGRKNVKVYFM